MTTTVFRSLAGWSLMFLWGLLLVWAPSVQAETIEMYPGEVATVDVGTVERVAVGNEEVAKVSIMDDDQLLLVAHAPGQTDLVVWREGRRESRYTVTVTGDDIGRRHSMVRTAISDFPNLTTRLVDGMVLIEGEVDPADMARYEALVDALPGVVSQATVAEVPMRDMIQIKAQIVEVDQDYRRNLGIEWADSMDGPTVAAAGAAVTNDHYSVRTDGNVDFTDLSENVLMDRGFHPFVGITTGLTSSIQLMQHHGVARTLAEPVLITRSGEPATFLSGGEIPYQARDEVGNTVIQFREFGIQLDIEPRSDGNGNILAHIEAEVSTADFATGVEGVPGLDSRRTESVINVNSGETILISGLTSTEESVSESGIPFLSDIPVLGRLFGTTDRMDGRRELIILVTPEITDRGEGVELWDRLSPDLQELQEIRRDDGIRDRLLD